ncbi:uncharacterized protein LOC131154370 isoform X2 [Malania oleifera]|uniref:uncharacterized protein LOC131154370 isoform X2 n=1 Tax=Malania oleifera TaxID=397392 RepID=UPI0025AE11B8|nr:uncharacterized protein LOC131154370 isoform X2 [Malania oleifera]
MKLMGGTQSPESTGMRLRRVGRKPDKIGSGIRPRKSGTPRGKSGALATPFLKWKFDDRDFCIPAQDPPVAGRRCYTKLRGDLEASVSARRLAAGLWQCRSSDQLRYECSIVHGKNAFPCHHHSREFAAKLKELPKSTLSITGPRNGILSKGAAKWDPRCQTSSDEVYHYFSSSMKLLEDQHSITVSAFSALRAELLRAQTRIQEFEAEQHSSKKRFDHFLKKLGEERTSWKRREHHKIHMIVEGLKEELHRERRNCQRIEIINTKLVNELADAKLSAKWCLQEYVKERKGRELMEEVCNELAKEIAEDKAEVEALKRESVRIYEEVEEERKMMQMAEIWREERVQMKLVDAKQILEHKYSQMNKLIADLEALLGSKLASSNAMESENADLIQQVANLVKIEDFSEFSYVAPKSYDIFSTTKEFHNGETNEKKFKPCANYHLASHASKVHITNPDIGELDKSHVQDNSVGLIVHDRGSEEGACGWVTVCHAEDQGSIYCPKECDVSVNKTSQGKNVSRSVTEWDERAGQYSPHTIISEVCSVSARQSNQQPSFVSRTSGSSPSNGVVDRILSVDANGRLSNGTISNTENISPGRDSAKSLSVVQQDPSVRWSASDLRNPHITRGIKGCIEWPAIIQKNSLKAKLLEARMEGRKILLRQVLEQKS